MKNEKNKLDNIDLKILNELQMNGDITNVKLANKLKISPPSCLRRVKSLERKNLILGYIITYLMLMFLIITEVNHLQLESTIF